MIKECMHGCSVLGKGAKTFKMASLHILVPLNWYPGYCSSVPRIEKPVKSHMLTPVALKVCVWGGVT